MTKKNRVATIIAACIVIAAGVTGSVYAAVTVAHDKEEAESSTVVTTQAETSTEAPTEATTEVVTTDAGTATEHSTINNAAVTTTSLVDVNTNGPPPLDPTMSQEEKDAEYQRELISLKTIHETKVKSYISAIGTPPKKPSEDAIAREWELYYEDLEQYQRNYEKYTPLLEKENEEYPKRVEDAKIRYNQK